MFPEKTNPTSFQSSYIRSVRLALSKTNFSELVRTTFCTALDLSVSPNFSPSFSFPPSCPHNSWSPKSDSRVLSIKMLNWKETKINYVGEHIPKIPYSRGKKMHKGTYKIYHVSHCKARVYGEVIQLPPLTEGYEYTKGSLWSGWWRRVEERSSWMRTRHKNTSWDSRRTDAATSISLYFDIRLLSSLTHTQSITPPLYTASEITLKYR